MTVSVLTSNGFAPANPTRMEIPVPLILSFTCVQSPQESHNPRSDAACVRCTMACFIPLTTHSRSEDSVFAISISRHIDKSGAVMAEDALSSVRIIYLQSLLPRCSPRCKPAACNFTRTIVVQHVQQTNVFVGNTLTDRQRESVFSGTTAPVGVILLPLPPITIAATYLRGSVFIRRRYI